MKILVIGFNRSGTTLLQELIGNHPDVVDMLHEARVILGDKLQGILSQTKINYENIGIKNIKSNRAFAYQKSIKGEWNEN